MAVFLGSRDLNKPELAVDAWLVMRYITIKDEERERNAGFFTITPASCEVGSCCGYYLPPAADPVRLTPNSKSMTPNHLCLDHDSGAGRPGHFLPEWRNVIHKLIELAIYIGFGFEYNRGRIIMVLHIASFRGDG